MSAKTQQYSAQFLPLFWDDLNAAVSYISDTLQAPKAAERLLNQVEESISNHLSNPTFAPVYKSSKKRTHPYYWYSIGNYAVFYVVLDDVVEFRRFLFGARDITKIIP